METVPELVRDNQGIRKDQDLQKKTDQAQWLSLKPEPVQLHEQSQEQKSPQCNQKPGSPQMTDQKQDPPQSLHDSSKGLEQILSLLKTKDDTSRFVGLALLKSILDTKTSLQKDPKVIVECWAAIPVNFLDRLLKAGADAKKTVNEAQNMAGLAVAVIHAFVVLLPAALYDNERFSGRCRGLVFALLHSPPDTSIQILQILLTFAASNRGAFALLRLDDWSPLLELASQEPLVLDIIKYTFMTASANNITELDWRQKFHDIIPAVILTFHNESELTSLFTCVDATLRVLPIATPIHPRKWLKRLSELLLIATIRSRLEGKVLDRQSAVVLSGNLLHHYPRDFSELLFDCSNQPEGDAKPKVYLYVKLLLVDIRSTISSLQEVLDSPDYTTISARLAASYDLILAFVGFLVSRIDDDSDEDIESTFGQQSRDLSTGKALPLPPDLLIQLRADIAETMSLTIEHCRDRWDASETGPVSLNSSTRNVSAPASSASAASLATTWESASLKMTADPLTLSQIQTLGVWLSEDDNENLRAEAAGIVDVLIGLYADRRSLDFRSAVLIALQGITATSGGVESFLQSSCWEILVEDLRKIFESGHDNGRGAEIVRTLLAIVDSEASGPIKEDWLDVLRMTSSTRQAPDMSQLQTALWLLGVELLKKAPVRMRQRHDKEARKMLDSIKKSKATTNPTSRDDEELGEIIQDLEEIGFS